MIAQSGAVRSFYLQLNETVGASEGVETNIVYAEYHRMGDVHGSPITRQELQRLGVIL